MTAFLIDRTRLLETLRQNHKKAKQYDDHKLSEHFKANEMSLKLFKQRLKDAASWDYDKLKEQGYSVGLDRYKGVEVSSCPTQLTPQYERAIKEIELSCQEKWTLDDRGKNAKLHQLVTWDLSIKDQAC